MPFSCDACSNELGQEIYCKKCYQNAHKKVADLEQITRTKDAMIEILQLQEGELEDKIKRAEAENFNLRKKTRILQKTIDDFPKKSK